MFVWDDIMLNYLRKLCVKVGGGGLQSRLDYQRGTTVCALTFERKQATYILTNTLIYIRVLWCQTYGRCSIAVYKQCTINLDSLINRYQYTMYFVTFLGDLELEAVLVRTWSSSNEVGE